MPSLEDEVPPLAAEVRGTIMIELVAWYCEALVKRSHPELITLEASEREGWKVNFPRLSPYLKPEWLR